MTPEQFRARRLKLELTQAELAGKLHVARESVNRWEAGTLPIDTRTKMALEHLACKVTRSLEKEIV